MRVHTVPLLDLLKEFGVPYYLKVDIEGHDPVAIRDIDPENAPPFVSMEIGSVEDFILLQSKGYTRFKCVQQGCFKETRSPELSFKSAFSASIVRLKSSSLVCDLRTRYRRLWPTNSSSAPEAGWSFPAGASGPFGNDAPGPWVSLDEALHAWLSKKLGHKFGYTPDSIGIREWFDVHATR